MALPVAEKHNFRMMPEIHPPTRLKSKMVDDYVDFIEKEKTTPWFGLNIDFGVFQNITNARGRGGQPGGQPMKEGSYSKPEEMIPLLPYVHCCHAKFNEMNDACECPNIPYAPSHRHPEGAQLERLPAERVRGSGPESRRRLCRRPQAARHAEAAAGRGVDRSPTSA